MVALVALSIKNEPAAQLVHNAACSSAAYVPDGHTVQGPAEPVSVRYVPVEHALQLGRRHLDRLRLQHGVGRLGVGARAERLLEALR